MLLSIHFSRWLCKIQYIGIYIYIIIYSLDDLLLTDIRNNYLWFVFLLCNPVVEYLIIGNVALEVLPQRSTEHCSVDDVSIIIKEIQSTIVNTFIDQSKKITPLSLKELHDCYITWQIIWNAENE